ncbi:hypothetical protein DL93DRAFT_2161591 [Clavulina sp. PMI_390]|nr:hypothetical protein DL93DRAFT_2161591 [Clavulina sp. PMI_390]
MEQTTTNDLFGLELQADVLSYKGLINAVEATCEGNPVFDLIVLRDPLRLSMLIPDLAGTAFDQLVLEDVVFARQNFSVRGSRGVGLHFNGALTIDETCGDLHTLVSNVLGCNDPTLELYCGLGYTESWSRLPSISSFTFEGNLPNINIGDQFKLTSLGARVFAFETSAVSSRGTMDKVEMSVGFGIFGTMSISAPSWDHPIEVEFDMEKVSSVIQLSTRAHVEWKDAFGLKGLTLKDVHLAATIDLDQPLSAQIFEIGASFTFGETTVTLDGAFLLGGEFTLEADVQRLTWGDIELLYCEIFREKLPRPSFDVKLRRGTLVISNTGYSLAVDHLEIGDYPPTNGTIALHPSGIHVKVAVDGNALHIGEFSLSKPHLAFASSHMNSAAAGDLVISGSLCWKGFTISASAHVYPSPDGDGKREYTIYGAFVPDDEKIGLRFARLIPQLEGTGFGDVTLNGAALVYASHEKATLPEGIVMPYQIRKGFYVCAKIGRLDAVMPFFPEASPDLKLSALFYDNDKMAISIYANDFALKLGEGYESEPLKFQLILDDSPIVRASCGLKVILEGQDPLVFRLAAALEPTAGEIELTAEMEGMWVNPFGINKHLQIGNVNLSFKLLGGTPQGVVVGGDVKIKDKVIKAKLGKGTAPGQTLLELHFEKIGSEMTVQIAETLMDLRLPKPPEVYFFEAADIFLCPRDMRVGEQMYKKGMSFRADMRLFGKKVKAYVELSSAGFIIEGEVEPFEIGPLRVYSTREKTALLHLHILKDKQSGLINGALSFADAFSTEIDCKFSLQPHFSFDFSFKLALFGDGVNIVVNAGPLFPLEPTNCDILSQRYKLHAKFEQKMLVCIRDLIHEGLKKCAEELQAKADSAKAWVRKSERDLSVALDHIRQCADDWKSDDVGKRSKYIKMLTILVVKRIELHPQDLPPDVSARANDIRLRLEKAKAEYDGLKSAREEIIDQHNVHKGIPFAEAFARYILQGLGAIVVAQNDTVHEIVKRIELNYLRSQKAAVDLIIELVPQEARGSLQSMAKQIEDDLYREEHNERWQDFVEDLRGIVIDILGDLLDNVLKMIQQISEAVAASVIDGITLGNGISQSALKFADGVMLEILSLLEIKTVLLDAEIGVGDKLLMFNAAVSGVLNDEPFTFQVAFEVGSPKELTVAVVNELTLKLKSLVV